MHHFSMMRLRSMHKFTHFGVIKNFSVRCFVFKVAKNAMVLSLCALTLTIVGCGKKKEEPRGVVIKTLSFGKELSNRLVTEKGFVPNNNCAKLVRLNDGQKVVEIYGSACTDGLPSDVAVTLNYITNRSMRVAREGGPQSYYAFKNDTPVGMLSSESETTAKTNAMDAMEDSRKTWDGEPGSITDVCTVNDLVRADCEILISGGSIRGLDTYAGMVRLSREEEILRQLLDTKNILANMIEKMNGQFEAMQKLIERSSGNISSDIYQVGRDQILLMLELQSQTAQQMSDLQGTLSLEMKKGFDANRLQFEALTALSKGNQTELKNKIDAQTEAIKKQMDTLATAKQVKDVVDQLTLMDARLQKTATQEGVDQIKKNIKDFREATEGRFDKMKEQLDTLATKKDLHMATKRILTKVGDQLTEIQNALTLVSTKKQVEAIQNSLADIKTTLTTLATLEKVNAIITQVEAIKALTTTLDTKSDKSAAAVAKIDAALTAQTQAVKTQLEALIGKSDKISTDMSTAVTSIMNKFTVVEGILKNLSTKEQADKIGEALTAAQETLKKLATKDQMDAVSMKIEAITVTIEAIQKGVGENKGAVDALQSSIDKQFKTLKEQVEKLATKDDVKGEIAPLTEKLKEIEKQISKISDTDVTNLTNLLMELKKAVEFVATKTQVEGLKSQLDGIKGQVEALKASTIALPKPEDLTKVQEALGKQIGAVKLQLDSLATKKEVTSVQEAITNQSQALDNLRRTIFAQNTIDGLRSTYNSIIQRADDLQAWLTRLTVVPEKLPPPKKQD